MAIRAGERGQDGGRWRRRRRRWLQPGVLIGIVLATIIGSLPLDVGRVSAASHDAGDALHPVQFVLDDTGFTPAATSAARGQTIWIDNTSSTPRTVTIGGPTLTSGPIPPGGRFVTALPIGGTFTLTDDAATPNEATLTIGLPVLPGSPTQNAIAQIPDQVPPPAPLDQHPDLTLYLSRSRVLIAPTAIASVAQINAALTANGLIIVGGIRAGAMLVTEPAGTSGPTDVVALQAIIDDLRSRPGIRSAAYEFALASTAALPRPVNPDPTVGLGVTPGSEYRNWEPVVDDDGGATGIGSNYGLEASRFPQVWNLLDETRRRSPSGPSTDTVVIDEGFDLSHPDLTGAELELLCTPGNTFCSDNPLDPTTGLPASDHGNAVAAVIGAPFDRGDPASRTSLGVVGANPTTDLHLVPANDPLQRTQFIGFADYMQTFHLVFDRRPTDFPQLRVVNLSLGPFFLGSGADWNARWGTTSCGPGFGDDATAPPATRVACTPNTLDAYLVEFRALSEFTRTAAERALGANVALVTAAGNESRQICGVVRAAADDPCPTAAVIDAENITPLAWIDRTWSGSRGSPILVAEAYDFNNRRASDSNRGTISAPGTVVAPLVLPDGSPGYQVTRGTSFASPFVAAAVGFLGSLQPGALIESHVAALKARGRADIDGTTTPRLDVFEAAVTLPGVLERLLDVNGPLADGNDRIVYGDDGVALGPDEIRATTEQGPRYSAPDGRVDLRDFRVFRDAFLDGCRRGDLTSPACPPAGRIALDGNVYHPKFDTNLDGCIQGEGVFGCDRSELVYSRLDFNGDGFLDDRPIRFPLTAGGAIAPPGTGTPMTDLDVFASRWGFGPNADTGGYPASRLPELMSSVDIQVRLDRLWDQGATSAEVSVVSTKNPDEIRRFIVPRSASTAPWPVVTMPVDPVDLSLVQVRVIGTIPGRDNPSFYLSPLLDGLPGGDLIVSACADQLTFTADPVVPEPGGSSTLTARLVDCLGNPVIGEGLDFEISEGPNGSSISRVEAITDANGSATTVFDMPLRVSDEAQVVVYAYPAIGGGERLQAFVNIGGEFSVESGMTVFYRSREVIEEYERSSTNEWADDADDCDGPIDATGSPLGCFASRQRLAFPDSIDEEAGVIMIDRRGRIEVEDGLAWDSLRIIGGLEADDYDPSVHYAFVPLVTNLLQWPAGNLAAATDQEIFSVVDITTPGSPSYEWSSEYPILLPDITYSLNASALNVFGLAAVNDTTYWQGTTHNTANVGSLATIHPDAPIGRFRDRGIGPHHQIPTELGVLNRFDGTSFPFALDVDGPLTVRRSPDGNFLTYTYCARNDRAIDSGGGYWSDTDPLEPWGRNPDDQRFERQPGDRAAPKHEGVVRGKSIFVATVSLDGTPPPEGALALPECDPPGGDASFTVSANPQEGRVVRFTPAASRTAGDDRLEYSWSFGDGNTSTERSPEHVYDDSGEYIVTLTVTDPEGGVGVDAKQISVANTPPNLWIEAARVNGTSLEFDIRIGEFSAIDGLGITVSIIGSSGFPVVPATPYPIGEHTITVPDVNPGAYTVTIFAIDKDGGTASRTLQLTVSSSTTTQGAIQPLMSPLMSPLASPLVSPLSGDDDSTPAPLGFRSAATTLSAQATASPVDQLASVAIPAFVVSSLDTTTSTAVQIRNASVNNGALVGTVFDLGDGRTGVPITAGATATIGYLDAGEPIVSTALAGLTIGTALRVTGTPVVPVVAYLGATTGFVGQEVELSARVTATSSTGDPVAGRPLTFSILGASVTAVTGGDGLATALLRLPAPAGATTVTVEVPVAGESAAASATAPFTVLANEPPTADAGGPYTVPIDGVLSLQATGADADDGAMTLGFAWDLDGDGDFDDAVGNNVVVTNQQLTSLVCGGACTSGQAYSIAVRVTDPKGATAVATTTITPISDFGLTITPASATLVPNSQTSFTVNVVTTNGFAAPVTLSAPSLPPDVTASFSPTTVTPNGSSVLTLRAGPNVQATPGTPLIVRGTAAGIVRETGGSVSLEFGLLPICYGTITGVVRDADTGEPLPGMPVGIVSIGRSTTTDDEGRYRFEQLPVASDNGPLAYGLRSNPVGYETRFFSATAACNVVTTADTTVTRLRFGAITGRVFLADPAGAIIGPLPNVVVTGPAGSATDAQGRYTKQNVALNAGGTPRSYLIGVNGVTGVRHPAVQASVTVRADQVTEAQDLVSYQMCFGSVRGRMIDDATGLAIPFARMTVSGRTITANAQGVAVMNDIPLAAPDNRSASLGVIGRPPTGTTLFRDPTSAILPRCGAVTPVDVPVTMPVENFATIAATIVDAETGLPVQGLQLGTANGARSPAASDAQGRVDWRVSLGLNNTTGNLSVFAVGGNGYFSSAAQGLALTANGTREVTFQVLRARFGAIEGQVTDAVTGAPLPAITVVMGFRNTTTDADGRYRFDNVGLLAGNLPATIQLQARDTSNVFEPIAYWFQNQTVTVAADLTSTADFALVPVCQGANVRGRVINAATGEPLEGALVGTGFDSRLTDAEGRFSFTDIRVGVQNAPRTISVSASRAGFTSATRQVTLFCGADIVVDFGTADVNAGTIEGRVTDESGTPIRDVFVGAEFGGAAVTGADGRYSILSVPVNSNGTSRDWGLTFIPAFGSGFQSATRTASVSSGAVTTVDAVLLTASAPNQPPAARITGAATAAEGSTVTLSAATSSDPDGTIALYEWDLDGNGTFEVSGADRTTVDVSRPDDGVATVRLRVTDDGGATATTTFAVTFTNVPPSVTLAADLVIDGLRITRSGSFSDPGTADTHLATVDWGAGAGPGPLALDGTSFSLDHTYLAGGTYTVVVEVCDDDASATVEGCGTATFQVTVTQPNRPPTATAASAATRQNRPVPIVLAGVDPDGDDLTYQIVEPPLQGTLSGDTPDLVYTPGADYLGNDRFTFTVSDGEATSEPAEISIRVTEANVAPTATITGPATTTEGSTITLSAGTSSDPDGTILAYEWDVDDDGSVDGTGTTIPISRDDDASVVVRLSVTDDEGLVGTTTVTVTFTNVAPTVTLADDLVVGVDRRVTRTGSFTDPGTADTHTATVDWGEGAGPEELVLIGASFDLDHTFAEPGTYTVIVEVCDDDDSDTVDGCGSAQFIFTIAPPRVNVGPTAVATGSLTALEGSTVTVSGADSTDPDGSIVTYEWDLDGDGLFERTGPTIDVSLRDQGQITVTLRVTDDDGASASTTRTITFTDVPPLIVLDDDLVVADDGTVTRSGRIVDPGLDDVHVVTVDWGDGSAIETLTVTNRSFQLRHRYVSSTSTLLGSLVGSATLQGTFVVVVTACDVALPTACGTTTFEVGSAPVPPSADLGVSVRPIVAPSPGQRIDVGVTVTNAGPSAALDVVVTLTLPPGTSTPGVESDGWRCGPSDSRGIVTCAPLGPELAVGAWALTLPVDVGLGAPNQLVFDAAVQSSTPDPTVANNRASARGDVVTVAVPTSPVAPPAVAPPPVGSTLPSGGLPATGNTGLALQLQLAALAAALGLAIRAAGRRRARNA